MRWLGRGTVHWLTTLPAASTHTSVCNNTDARPGTSTTTATNPATATAAYRNAFAARYSNAAYSRRCATYSSSSSMAEEGDGAGVGGAASPPCVTRSINPPVVDLSLPHAEAARVAKAAFTDPTTLTPMFAVRNYGFEPLLAEVVTAARKANGLDSYDGDDSCVSCELGVEELDAALARRLRDALRGLACTSSVPCACVSVPVFLCVLCLRAWVPVCLCRCWCLWCCMPAYCVICSSRFSSAHVTLV